MARRGRPPALDDTKKSQITALLAVGCSQRTAARYVGCAPATILNTVQRDAKFAAEVRRAQRNAEVGLLRYIREAAQKPAYWRAAAWMLERGYPQRYARRGPDVITAERLACLLAHLCQILVEEVPVARYRKAALKRLDDLGKQLTGRPLQLRDERKPEGEHD